MGERLHQRLWSRRSRVQFPPESSLLYRRKLMEMMKRLWERMMMMKESPRGVGDGGGGDRRRWRREEGTEEYPHPPLAMTRGEGERCRHHERRTRSASERGEEEAASKMGRYMRIQGIHIP